MEKVKYYHDLIVIFLNKTKEFSKNDQWPLNEYYFSYTSDFKELKREEYIKNLSNFFWYEKEEDFNSFTEKQNLVDFIKSHSVIEYIW